MNELTPNVPNESQAAPAVQDAVPPVNKGGRPRKPKIAETLAETLKQIDDLLKSENPNATKQRLLDKKLEYYLAQQKREDERRNNQTLADNQRLKADVEMLQKQVSELQPKADDRDTAVAQAQEAQQMKQQLESELQKLRSELAIAARGSNGLRLFAEVIAGNFDDADKMKLFVLKLFLALGTEVPDQVYTVLGVADDLSLWQQLERAWGKLTPAKLIEIYKNLAPTAVDKRWFLKSKLRIDHEIDADGEVRELHRQERVREEQQERLRENRRSEAEGKAEARLQEAERDPAGRPTFGPWNPNVEYIP